MRAVALLFIASVAGAAPGLHHVTVGAPAARDTVIVIHGGPGLSLDHLLPLGRLAADARRRVIFYEQRGAGDSPRPADGDYSLDAHVADLDAVRRDAGAEAVHLVAHSWGTVIALAYALRHPDHVASVVLIGMGAPSDAEDRRSFGAAFAARRARLVEQGIIVRHKPPPEGDDCMASFSVSLPAHFADARHRAARRLPGSYRCGVAGATLRAASGWDFRRDLPALVPPVLLISGDADANLAGARVTVARLPAERAVLGVLPRCGHFPWLECPEPFFAMVELFLGYSRRATSAATTRTSAWGSIGLATCSSKPAARLRARSSSLA